MLVHYSIFLPRGMLVRIANISCIFHISVVYRHARKKFCGVLKHCFQAKSYLWNLFIYCSLDKLQPGSGLEVKAWNWDRCIGLLEFFTSIIIDLKFKYFFLCHNCNSLNFLMSLPFLLICSTRYSERSVPLMHFRCTSLKGGASSASMSVLSLGFMPHFLAFYHKIIV